MNVGTDLHNCKPVRRSRAVCARLCKVKGRPGLALAMTLGIIASLGRPDSSHAAGLVISAPEITTSAGSTGAFLVLLTDTDPTGSTPYNVAGDQFELTLTGPAGFSFTDVSTDTGGSPYNTPYIYSVSTADQLGLSLSIAPTNPFTVPTTDFLAADSGYYQPGGYPGYTSLNPGDVYALALVSYSVDATVPMGSVATIGFNLANTNLSNNLTNSIPFSTASGSITIAMVPEPSTLALGAIAIVVGSLAFGSRRRVRGAKVDR